MTLREKLVGALGLAEAASVEEIQVTIDRLLADHMTPEEKDALFKKKKKDEEDVKAGEHLGDVRKALGLAETADHAAVLAAITTLRGGEKSLSEGLQALREANGTMKLELKELKDKVVVLEPQAQKVVQLEKDAQATEKKSFFERQLREGKLKPVDRTFYEEIWDTGGKVRGTLVEKFTKMPAFSEVSAREIGHGGEADPALKTLGDDTDPRVTLDTAAKAIMVEKGIEYMKALGEAKEKHPELVERIRLLVGPEGARR